MGCYRDEVPRVTLAQIRAQFTRRAFRSLRSVEIEHRDVGVRVAIEERADTAARGGWRRWLICPSCGASVTVLGLVGEVWRCRRCGGWRSRNRPSLQRPSPSFRGSSVGGAERALVPAGTPPAASEG